MALKSSLILLAAVAQLSFSCEALDCGCSVPRIYSVGDCCNGLRKTVIVKNDQPCCGSSGCGCGCGTCGCNKKCGDTIVIKEPSTCCGASPAVVSSYGPYYGGLNSYYGGYGPYGCGSACGYAAGYPYGYGYNSGCGYGYGSTCGSTCGCGCGGSTCGCGCGSTCGCGCGSTCGKNCGDTIVIKEPTCRCPAC